MVSATLRFQRFDRHLLSCVIPFWIISAEFNFAKVTLVLNRGKEKACHSRIQDFCYEIVSILNCTFPIMVRERERPIL